MESGAAARGIIGSPDGFWRALLSSTVLAGDQKFGADNELLTPMEKIRCSQIAAEFGFSTAEEKIIATHNGNPGRRQFR
jgi:hypothetical protein